MDAILNIPTFIADCGDLVGTLAARGVDLRSPTYISGHNSNMVTYKSKDNCAVNRIIYINKREGKKCGI